MSHPSDGYEAGVSGPLNRPSWQLTFTYWTAILLVAGIFLGIILDFFGVIDNDDPTQGFVLFFGLFGLTLAEEIRRVYRRLAKLERQMYGKN